MQRNTHTFYLQIVALVSALVLCFALTVPVMADELLSGNLRLFVSAYDSGTWKRLEISNLTNGVSNSVQNVHITPFSRYGWVYMRSDTVQTSANGAYGLYLSCYYRSSSGASQNHVPTKDDFSLFYTLASVGSSAAYPVQSVRLFNPSSSYNSVSDGVTVSARFFQTAADPVSTWRLANGSLTVPSWTFDSVSSDFSDAQLVITSLRVVSTSSSAELDALEDMASEIANQSQILSQFYGDIVAICNQIYQRLGDLQAAQEEANALFSNVISILNTTNGKLEAINMAMSTYFELLINQLKQEGVDTRTAIADAEARLETYLKPMIDYFNELEEQTGESAATLPQHKTDIDGFDNQGYGIDSDGQAGVAALVPVLTSFSWIFQIIAIFIGVGVINLLVKKGLS